MSQPAAYERSYSFTNFQTSSPTTPLPADELDAELNNIKTTFDQTLQNLALIQRDDGSLANASVGVDQLSDDLTLGFTGPRAWAQNTQYFTSPASYVFFEGIFYRCATSHTSGGAFESGNWEIVADLNDFTLGAASAVAFTPVGNVVASNVQAAIAEVDAEKALLVHSHVTTDLTDSTVAGRAMLTAASVAAQLILLGLTNRYFQPGDTKNTQAIALESGWLWCDGASVLRATYPNLWAAISVTTTGNTAAASAVVQNIPDTSAMRAGMTVSGANITGFATTILSVDSSTQITLSGNASGTTVGGSLIVHPYGVVDSTHFYVPDIRGRSQIGRDDMGGSIAGRVTLAGTGTLGTRLGAAGGAQTHTLTSAQLASHTHVGTTDNGSAPHTHTVANAQAMAIAAGAGVTVLVSGANTYGSSAATDTTHTHTFTSAANIGGDGAHNNMGPFLVCNTIIKT